MKHSAQLVDLKELKALMTGVELSEPKLNEYINARWLKYVEWWDGRSRSAKWKYQAMRSAVVIGGALIPALVGLRELQRFAAHEWMFAVASIVASLVVAICAGLESLFGFGEIWREKRRRNAGGGAEGAAAAPGPRDRARRLGAQFEKIAVPIQEERS